MGRLEHPLRANMSFLRKQESREDKVKSLSAINAPKFLVKFLVSIANACFKSAHPEKELGIV